MVRFKARCLWALLIFCSLPTYAFAQDFDAEFVWRYFYIPVQEKSQINYGQYTQRSLDPESINVLVWNVYKGKNDGFHRDYYDYSVNQDILMIQEVVNTPEFLESSLALDEFGFDFAASFGYKKTPEKLSGTMLGSRVAPARAWFARTKDLEPLVRTPKVLTMGLYPIEGRSQELLAINIHGVNMTNQEAFERHLELAMNQIQDHNGPIIFAGDFNTRTKKRLAFMRELLVDQWGMQEMSFRNDDRMRSFLTGHIIDFTFTKGLEVVDSEVLGHLESSDHKAMMFEVRVPQE